MRIGVPKELKTREERVGLTPPGVEALVRRGHRVLVERGAGVGAGLPDDAYEAAGADLVPAAADAWSAELVIKVKEPLEAEFAHLRPGLILYTYLHLAAFEPLTRELLRRRVDAVAYETVRDRKGGLPLLRPMSEIAGRMATQVGAQCLEKTHGGKGRLLGGVPGVRRGRVTVLGGGVVGTAAAQIAIGMGASVRLLDIDVDRMTELERVFGSRIETLYSDPSSIRTSVAWADLVIGAVLIPGATAPVLVTRDDLAGMEAGSVIVDVAVDQGGCVETCRPTTHDAPTFEVEGVLHYCVANMPGAVPQTATSALSNVTLPYALKIADSGLEQAAFEDPALASGVNTYRGHCVCGPVAQAHDLPFADLMAVLGSRGD